MPRTNVGNATTIKNSNNIAIAEPNNSNRELQHQLPNCTPSPSTLNLSSRQPGSKMRRSESGGSGEFLKFKGLMVLTSVAAQNVDGMENVAENIINKVQQKMYRYNFTNNVLDTTHIVGYRNIASNINDINGNYLPLVNEH
ncbi:8160_t:CDS:2 [Diversispora eburnea]|uniref:8160_t:CDS:1 n=1 Tax=Diversispora eburnea TaxID=1213867 RepID=A0A9N8VD65_9GLOM|nr:8160_t:CDS:2 [Diversispora eburnea]